jgi:hypothetical protein
MRAPQPPPHARRRTDGKQHAFQAVRADDDPHDAEAGGDEIINNSGFRIPDPGFKVAGESCRLH